MASVGVDFAAFWAVMVFFFYYIPTVGSILAIVAPAMLTLVQFDNLTPFLIVLLVFGTIQVVTANVIEPAIMGSTLNLSPLVVIVSLMVWGTIWGVVGMFLCVPITVVSLIVLAQFETTRPIAVLLSADGRIPGAAAMRTLTLLAMLVVAAAQAQAQAQAPPAEPAAQAQPPGPQVMYACPGGTDFAAAFSKDGDLATISVPGQPEVELPRQPSGSGFAFGDSYYELRGRGREATLTAGGRSMRCHAIGRPGEPPRTYQGGGLTITLFPDGIFRLRDRSGATETRRSRPMGAGGRWRCAPGAARRHGRPARLPRGRWRQACRRERQRSSSAPPPPIRSTIASGSPASIATPRPAACSPNA